MVKNTSNSLVEDWDTVISAKRGLFSIPFKEIWGYRDLLVMFVKRDIVTMYKQTILGPVWFFIQPILTTIVYMIVFGGIAQISTDGLPRILFYSAGIVMWNYYSDLFTLTSRTFIENANLFGKVYFPRIIVPFSKVISGGLKFGVQLLFFLSVFSYHFFIVRTPITPNLYLIFLPFLVILIAGLGVGCGVVFSSLTTKYRDLVFLMQFGIQLMMYATPVIYPVSSIPEKYRIFIMLNPVSPIVEGFRYAFLGVGEWSWGGLAYSSGFALVLFTVGIVIFNRIEKNFMDTV